MRVLPLAALVLRVLRLVLVAGAALCAANGLAAAHHFAAGTGGGVAIPSLAHGQMEVYARHWSEIIGLAGQARSPSPDFSRVLNFARIQKSWCLWGLAPAAITDEASPFNECSHAYLAAARALLDELREQATADAAAERLAATIDRELVLAGAPVICGFSGENFDTAQHIVPRWSGIPGHPASMGFAAALAMLLLGVAAAGRHWLAPPPAGIRGGPH